MSQTYYAILTAIGEAKLANAAALGTTLQLTQMAVGDGGGATPQPSRTQTSLVGEKRRGPLNRLSIDPANASQIIAEHIIPEDVGGWWIRELGLYDAAGDLCAVANCPDTYKPVLASGSGRIQTIRMVLIVANTNAVQRKIVPSVVLAPRGYVKQVMADHLAAQDPHPQYTTDEEVSKRINAMAVSQSATAFTSSGTESAYTLTPSPALTALAANTRYRVKFHTSNSGAATLAVSGLTAKGIKQYDASGAKVAAVIKTSQLADVEYDGSDWVIVDPIPAGIAASSVQTITATGTLPAAVVGGTAIINSASATTQTLPAANTVSAGGRIELMNIGAGLATISRAGTDTINPNGTTVTSMVLGKGDTLTLESNGGNGWYAVGGSAQLGFSGAFGAAITGSGYQKLPGGLIIQWGRGQSGTYTFPIAFPNAVLRIITAEDVNTTSAASGQYKNIATQSLTQFTTTTAISLLSASAFLSWIAIGY